MTDEQIEKELRKAVREWAGKRRLDMQYQIARMGLQETSELYNSIRAKVKSKLGVPERVTFSFARHGIFQELGVGRGTKSADRGTTNRKAKKWITAALPITATEELANIVVQALGDKAVESIKIGLPSDKVKI